jgi:capsular exopolysaccharide synthesis family protein
MDLTAHLSVIFQRKWQVLAASILIAAAVFAWRSSAPPTYTAGSLLNVVSSRAIAGETLTEQDTLFIGQSYAAMATTRPVVQDAIDRAGVDVDVTEAERRLSVDASQPGYIQINASGPEKAEAVDLSQGLADAVIAAVNTRQTEQLDRQLAPVEAQIASVEAELNGLKDTDPRRRALELQYQALLQNATETRLRPVDRLSIVTPARAEPEPIAPRPKRDAILALIAALVVNAELAVALSALSGRFSGGNLTEQVTRATGLPVLAEVPQEGRRHEHQVVEAFRTLRTNLLFLRGEGELHSIAVVGGEPGSGKSFVAEHLCRAMARPGTPVLLVDGDLRNPSLHTRLGVEVGPGLADALAPPYTLAKPTEVEQHRNLRLLPAGSRTGDPAALFTGKTFERLLERMRTLGMIVVDTPPLSLFADAAAVAQNCDATVLVIDIKKARRREVQRMIESLAQVGVVPLGIVLNRVKTASARTYGGYRDASRRTRLAPTGTSAE